MTVLSWAVPAGARGALGKGPRQNARASQLFYARTATDCTCALPSARAATYRRLVRTLELLPSRRARTCRRRMTSRTTALWAGNVLIMSYLRGLRPVVKGITMLCSYQAVNMCDTAKHYVLCHTIIIFSALCLLICRLQ